MPVLRYVIRGLLKSPGFTTIALIVLALGIGANTAIFSVVSGVLLRPLPFPDPDRLVQLNEADPRNGVGVVSYPDLQDWRKQATSFEDMIAYGNSGRNLQGIAEPERIATVWAERGLFRMLNAEPVLGRIFRDDDPLNVVVLAAGFWKRRFGGDPSLIGRTITLDGKAFTIIGVMPEAFQFPYRAAVRTELWIPWEPPARWAHERGGYRVDFVAGRIKKCVTVEAARNELSVIAKRLQVAYPATNAGREARVTPLSEVVVGRVRPALFTLMGAVGLVLLIACANVANLLLARGARRAHEVAVRIALGANARRVIQQFLTESLVLAAAGGAIGLALAIWGTSLLLKLGGSQIPRSWEIGLDWRVFAFLLGICVITGIGFGLTPALAASRVNVQGALKENGRVASRHGRLGDGLIVAEIALSFVLLMGAGLLLRAFLYLENTPTGFVSENVLTLHLSVSIPELGVPGAYGRYVHELEERIQQIPGVRAAGFIQYLPLQNSGWTGWFSIAGRPREAQQPRAELRYVSPGYFRAFGIPIRQGRSFTDRDSADAPRVILINETLARRYFPNEDPVGKLTDRGTIVGVAGDVRQAGLDRLPDPEIYYSFAQNPAATTESGVSALVSSLMPPDALAGAVRDAIHQVNPNQVIFNIRPMQRVIADSLSDLNLYRWLLGLFAGLALALAVAGIYGVISYAVTARTQEFGIRIALGADRARVLALVLSKAAVLTGLGLAAGIGASFGLTRLLKSLLVGITPTDPVTFVAVSVLLALAVLLACLVPARRAMRVDPIVALRYE